MRLSFKAAARAASSMRLPRAVLTRKAPRIEKGEKKTKLNYVITYIHALVIHCSFMKYHMSTISVKFMFSKKATKMDEIFTVDLTLLVLEVVP